MWDRSIAEPVLYRPGIVAGIGQGVPACVPQHVGVHRKGKTGAGADALDQPVDGVGRERAVALDGEDESRPGIAGAARAALAPRRPVERVNARLPVFRPAHRASAPRPVANIKL
jgi:hypothetical protein